MKADPASQRRLLDLQAVDTAAARLEQRLQGLPIHKVIADLARRRQTSDDTVVAARTALDDAELARQRAEGDVAPVKERLARNQKRVHDGSLDAKALTSAISEIAHLKARITKLEDQELEAMEAQEAAEAQLAKATQEAAAVEESLREALAEREAVVAEARQEMKGHRAARAAVLEGLPDDLVALYDRLRARYHGVGAARLEGHRCTGCGLEATTADYNRYVAAAPDELLRCTECDRILVRAV